MIVNAVSKSNTAVAILPCANIGHDMNGGKLVGAVYWGSSKAYVPLIKLPTYKVAENELNWSSFLTGAN